MIRLILCISFFILLAGCGEDTPPEKEANDSVIEIDIVGVRPALYFSVSNDAGLDIFKDSEYSIENFRIKTKVSRPGNDGYSDLTTSFYRLYEIEDKTIIGVDDVFTFEEFVFDYGNGDFDTVTFENGKIMGFFRRSLEVPEFTGTFRVIFNGTLASELEFAPSNDNIKMLFERNILRGHLISEIPLGDPYIFELSHQ